MNSSGNNGGVERREPPLRAMSEGARVVVLVLIMAIALVLTTGITIGILYRTASEQEETHLVEAAKSQARLIEAIAREEATHQEMYGDEFDEVVLGQIIDAHHEYEGSGKSGEFTLARREGDLIVFLLGHRHARVELPDPVPFQSTLAEPMRRALNGQSGTMVGLDYSGATVVAAYEPVQLLDVGIVAKIDLQEVRAPFVNAGLIAVGFSLLVATAGAFLVVRVSKPLVTEIEERSLQLADSVAALSDSEERIRKVFEMAGVGIAQVSLEGVFTDVNQEFLQILGYTHEEIVRLSFRDITYPEDLATDLEYMRQLMSGEIDRFSREKRYLRKDSSSIWANLTVSLVRAQDGSPRYFIAVVEDITSRKDIDLAVKKSLAEKEVLLREIHHRVKNNMQVISSLLSLQASTVENAQLSELIQESRSRVRAMALIHEILYESSDLTNINLDKYLSRLTASMTRTYGAESDLIRLEVEPKELTLGIDATVPCSLAINELISNSLKHGYPDDRTRHIGIQVNSTADDEIAIVVSDNGVGLPPDFDIRKTDTMGLGLVVGLVERQLGGRLEVDRSQGTRFTIIIDPKRPIV